LWPGCAADTSSLLAPRSWKSRAIPLPPPLGHNRACNRVTLPFYVCMYGGCNSFCKSLRSNLRVLQTGLKNTRLWSMTHAAVRTCSGNTVYATQLLKTVTVEVQEQRLAINLNHTIKQTLNYQHLLLPLHKTLQMTVTCLHFSEDL
jgi:hypothetical protein